MIRLHRHSLDVFLFGVFGLKQQLLPWPIPPAPQAPLSMRAGLVEPHAEGLLRDMAMPDHCDSAIGGQQGQGQDDL